MTESGAGLEQGRGGGSVAARRSRWRSSCRGGRRSGGLPSREPCKGRVLLARWRCPRSLRGDRRNFSGGRDGVRGADRSILARGDRRLIASPRGVEGIFGHGERGKRAVSTKSRSGPALQGRRRARWPLKQGPWPSRGQGPCDATDAPAVPLVWQRHTHVLHMSCTCPTRTLELPYMCPRHALDLPLHVLLLAYMYPACILHVPPDLPCLCHVTALHVSCPRRTHTYPAPTTRCPTCVPLPYSYPTRKNLPRTLRVAYSCSTNDLFLLPQNLPCPTIALQLPDSCPCPTPGKPFALQLPYKYPTITLQLLCNPLNQQLRTIALQLHYK